MDVKGFFGKYRDLSNFGNGVCYWRGYKFPCRENAFQFAKGFLGGSEPTSELMTRFYCSYNKQPNKMDGVWLPQYTAKEAKQAGKKVQMAADWDKVKVEVMHEIVLDCFNRNHELKMLLFGTGDGLLEESNYWHDAFWGVCYGTMKLGTIERHCKLAPHSPEGENNLGKILMRVREELKK